MKPRGIGRPGTTRGTPDPMATGAGPGRRAVLMWRGTAAGVGSLFAVGLAFKVAAVAAADGEETAWASGNALGDVGFALMVLVFPVAGAAILRRQPRNRIGWLLLSVGVPWGLDAALQGFATVAWIQHGRLVGPSQVAVAVDQATWVPAVGLMGTFLLLLFPDGRLPSPRWRWVARVAGANIVVAVLAMPLAPGTVTGSGYPTFANPLGIEALRPLTGLIGLNIALIPLFILAAAASLVVRFRRSRGVERLQLRWLATAGAIVAFLYLVSMTTTFPSHLTGSEPRLPPGVVEALQYMAILSFALLPISVGIAVLRYRLYDLGRIVNRTVVYGTASILLGGIYAGLALGLGSLTGGDSALVVAGSTLVVAALFNPLRRRLQSLIDRRFYRRRYDAERTLAAFGARLRDQVDLDELAAHLVHAVGETVQPMRTTLWLRGEDPVGGGGTPMAHDFSQAPGFVTISERPAGTTEGTWRRS